MKRWPITELNIINIACYMLYLYYFFSKILSHDVFVTYKQNVDLSQNWT